jgi:hypothetical protein
MSNNESAFRSSLTSLGWGTSNQQQSDVSTQPASLLTRLNPFSRGRIRLGDDAQSLPTQLPAPTREEEQGAFFVLSRWDRILVFGACILGAAVCFVVAFLLLPVLAFKPRKFAVLWTVGSLLFMISFGFLQGFVPYIRHLLTPQRLPFTIAYFGSMILTLYFAVGLRNLILTIITIIIQVISLITFFISYVPGGVQGLRYGGQIVARRYIGQF